MGRGPVGEPAIIKYVNNSLASVDDVSNTDGAMILIKTLTASSSANLSFVNGTSDVVLDSTYPIYKFVWTNIHPGTDDKNFQVNFRDGGSSYDATKTSTSFGADHTEAGSGQMDYITGIDQANGTSFQNICSDGDIKTDNDSSLSGTLHLFNPSSTTFVKHFIATTNHMVNNSQSSNNYIGGYFNTTSAIDEIQFKFDSGDIDAGTIKLYGIKDS